MINLLSDSKKAEIRAARTNTILVRYIGVLLLALLFISGVMYVSNQTLKSLDKTAVEQLSSPGVSPGAGSTSEPDQQLLSMISSQINSGSSVSGILSDLASAIPSGVIMKQLSISNNLSAGPLVLTFYSKPDVQSEDIIQALRQTNRLSNATDGGSVDSKDMPGYPKKHTINVTANSTGRIMS